MIIKKEEQALISWEIDEIRIEYRNIKYLVEIKEDKNENFSSFIVSKSNMKFKYKKNTDYEFKIRVIIDDSYGEYSETKRFKEKSLYEKTDNIFENINYNPLFENKPKVNNIFSQNSNGFLFGKNDDEKTFKIGLNVKNVSNNGIKKIFFYSSNVE